MKTCAVALLYGLIAIKLYAASRKTIEITHDTIGNTVCKNDTFRDLLGCNLQKEESYDTFSCRASLPNEIDSVFKYSMLLLMAAN